MVVWIDLGYSQLGDNIFDMTCLVLKTDGFCLAPSEEAIRIITSG